MKEIREIKEIISGPVHCFSNCGYNCLASVKAELEEHYSAMLDDAGKGWEVHTWHNGGWHCQLHHPASGFFISDRGISGGSQTVRHIVVDEDRRYYCNNYSTESTGQVRAWGASPAEAIEAAMKVITQRREAYSALSFALITGRKLGCDGDED